MTASSDKFTLASQHLDDLVTGNAPKRIKSVFGKLDPKATHRFVPRDEMKRHRVGQRAVAIKNEGLNHL